MCSNLSKIPPKITKKPHIYYKYCFFFLSFVKPIISFEKGVTLWNLFFLKKGDTLWPFVLWWKAPFRFTICVKAFSWGNVSYKNLWVVLMAWKQQCLKDAPQQTTEHCCLLMVPHGIPSNLIVNWASLMTLS